MAKMLEQVSDLFRGDANERQRWQVVLVEKFGAAGFVTALRRAASDFGEKEKLVGVKGVGRMTVKIAVKNGGEFGDADLVAGFFAHFAGGGDGGRFADIGPTAGECPATIFEFMDEENLVVFEGGDTCVDFGSSVARLLGEEIFERLRVGFT